MNTIQLKFISLVFAVSVWGPSYNEHIVFRFGFSDIHTQNPVVYYLPTAQTCCIPVSFDLPSVVSGKYLSLETNSTSAKKGFGIGTIQIIT